MSTVLLPWQGDPGSGGPIGPPGQDGDPGQTGKPVSWKVSLV